MHNFDLVDVPISEQGGTKQKVVIGKGSWMGNNSVVLADVGEHAIVGAGSVITKPAEDYGIYVGNPAKLLRSRNTDDKAK